jgi:glutaredoxin
MRPALRLFSQAAQHARITFFTRQGCQLCVNAEETLSNVWDKRPFVYEKIDVMTPEQTRWRNLYEFDTPVVSLWPLEGGHANSRRYTLQRARRRRKTRR